MTNNIPTSLEHKIVQLKAISEIAQINITIQRLQGILRMVKDQMIGIEEAKEKIMQTIVGLIAIFSDKPSPDPKYVEISDEDDLGEWVQSLEWSIIEDEIVELLEIAISLYNTIKKFQKTETNQ